MSLVQYTHTATDMHLSVCDCIKQCKVMRSAMEVVEKISRLVKKSPKKNLSFDKNKSTLAPNTPGFRTLCPTRWTVCVATLKSVIDNYEVLLDVWKESQRGHLDGELKARIVGV